ncbi:unnamed protein product [Rhodiola kirilowii]
MDEGRLEEEVDSITGRMGEKLVVSLEDSDWRRMSEEGKWAIVVKLANGMSFNIKGLANVLTKIWNMENRVSFVELANNMALAKFKTEGEMKKIWDGGPWLCMDTFILMHEWCPDLAPEEFVMNRLGVWAQMHNLPVGATLNDKEYGEKLAGYIGKFVKVSQSESEGVRKRYVRVRVEVEVDRPLVNGFLLNRLNRDPLWVSVKYERLPESRSRCGRLDHKSEVCGAVLEPVQTWERNIDEDLGEKRRAGSRRSLDSEESTELGGGRRFSSGRNREETPDTQRPERTVIGSGTSEGAYEKEAGGWLEKARQDTDVSLDGDVLDSLAKKSQRFTLPATERQTVDSLEEDRHDRWGEKATRGILMKEGELDSLIRGSQSSKSLAKKETFVERRKKEGQDKANEKDMYGISRAEDVWKDLTKKSHSTSCPLMEESRHNSDITERGLSGSNKEGRDLHNVEIAWADWQRDLTNLGRCNIPGPNSSNPNADRATLRRHESQGKRPSKKEKGKSKLIQGGALKQANIRGGDARFHPYQLKEVKACNEEGRWKFEVYQKSIETARTAMEQTRREK